MGKPLCVDLFCGLGGWAEGFLAEGYDVIGFDIERHDYGTGGYPGQLALQDVLTLHGSQFKDADVIVASPPCTEYSYMAMPWKRAKQIAAALRRQGEFPEEYKGSRTIPQLNALFDACFRIQREACEAAERYIPMVVENVRGARPWVGEASWSFGSYYLWGDVPALMPKALNVAKVPGQDWNNFENGKPVEAWNDAAVKLYSLNGGRRTDPGKGARFAGRDCGVEGLKFGGGWWHDSTNNLIRKASSRSPARKAASAQIAKIPLALAQHIARVYKPIEAAA